MKMRITCTAANAGNFTTYIQIGTSCSSTSRAYLYPEVEETPTLSLTGLATGSEVVIFDDSWNELDREVISGTTYTYDYDWNSDDGDFDVNILIWKNNKNIIKTSTTLTDEDQSIPISQTNDLVYQASTTANFTINYSSKLFIMDGGETELQIPILYSAWKDNVRLTNNIQYDLAMTQKGNDVISGTTVIADYAFLSNGWKIRPDEADHTLSITQGILVTDDESDPFVDTLGAYTVRVRYEQPVQVLKVSNGSPNYLSLGDILVPIE